MVKKRKNESCPAQAIVKETQGLHGVSDESRRVIFNAAAIGLLIAMTTK
jgi:hypothetical protein